jgi:hypothetical protein
MQRQRWIFLGLVLAFPLIGPGAVPAAAVTIGCSQAQRNHLDLNGDGFDDAVVGDPYATVNGKAEAGAIVVLFGDADGRIGEGSQRRVLTQASVAGSNVEAGDRFGWSVAMDDASADGCADILVGSPGEDWSGHPDAGIAHVITFSGTASGGPGTPSTYELLSQENMGGATETGDQFGYAVALGEPDIDEAPFVVVGAPGEDIGSVDDAGVVNVSGYVDNGQFQQGSRGLPGTPEPGDRFGSSVLVSLLHPVVSGPDADVEGTDWVLVAGAPGDQVPNVGSSTSVDGAGSVTFWESVVGYRQLVTQNSPGVPGVAEAGDAFGSSIAVGESRGTRSKDVRIDVAVGSPREDVGTVRDAGSVTLLTSEQTGITGRVALDQDTAGFAGSVEAGDRFGQSVALRPRWESSEVVLAVGVPDEDLAAVADAGLVQTVRLADAVENIEPLRSYTENSAGTPGTVARGNRFGRTVAVLEGSSESVIAISSPYQKAGSVFLVDTAGRTRSWVPGQGGIPTLPSGRFGWALSGLEIG